MSALETEISELVAQLAQKKGSGQFSPYIESIRFPFYRSLAPNTSLTFTFPVTAFVGPNGAGKTSTLHALYGSPKDRSVGEYWFSTHVDPIKESPSGERHSLIYTYKRADGTMAEVLKTRIKRDWDPDYWEPSRPIAKYGMQLMKGQRHPALDMPTELISFRGSLSAFDQYWYFGGAESRLEKKSYLRTKARQLRSVLEKATIFTHKERAQNAAPEDASKDLLAAAGKILNRRYTAATFVDHKFYKFWGQTLRLTTNHGLNYTEAFAGSGEMSVFNLVRRIQVAKNGSLVLLDEPETSLHPAAQRKMLHFVLRSALEKGLQVVISTHSAEFVRGLPPASIKMFLPQPDGTVAVRDECAPVEAFHEIGAVFQRPTILVEDMAAKELVEAALRSISKAATEAVDVIFLPG